MKKIITLLLVAASFSTSSVAQNPPGNIDTAKQTVTMKVRDFLYFSAYMAGTTDSINQKEKRRIEAKLKTYTGANGNTVITIDNMRGNWVIRFLEVLKGAPAGEIEILANASITNLTNVTNNVISFHWGIIVGRAQSGYNDHVKTGKDMYFDSF